MQAQDMVPVPMAWQPFLQIEGKNAGQAAAAHVTGKAFYLLQLKAPEKLEQLRQSGLRLYRQLDRLHWIVVVSDLPAEAMPRANSKGYSFSPVNSLWKLSPPLLEQAGLASWQQGLFVLKGEQHHALKEELKQLGNEVLLQAEYASASTLVVHCSYLTLFTRVLPLASVLFADIYNKQVQEESRLLEADISLNGINVVHHTHPQLQGQGMLISIKEQKYDPTDLDLQGRHFSTYLDAVAVSKHATDMATMIAGGGNTSPKSKGVAPEATLTSSSFENLLPDPDLYFQQNKIVLQNHSYGTVTQNYYGAEAAAYDASSLKNPAVLHVFSSGNSGSASAAAGAYKDVPGFAMLSGNFKQAKNILVVGAVDSLKKSDPFVSKGPGFDGRVKPDLVAYSADGSSSAAALVSGTAALLQQAYRQNNQGQSPPAELLKALLINAAEDVEAPGPDYLTGYGNLQAHRALKDLSLQQYFRGTLASGERQSFPLTIPSNVRELKLSLVWHDGAAMVNSATALVNDLDLQLVELATGTSWLPWILNPYPHEDSLRLPARRGVDRLNNVEQISLKDPRAGAYTIQVNAFDVPQGPQSFTIVYRWEMADTFRWTYPTGSDNMPLYGEQSVMFRWESAYGEKARGMLELSTDGGLSWQMLAEDLDLQQGYFQAKVPLYAGPAQARMTIGDTRYQSDSFIISRQLRPSVGFTCKDSLMLSWPNLSAATGYVVYAMAEKYLQPIARLSDTLLVLKNQQHPYQYYAVAPVLAGGRMGVRSDAFDYKLQGADCYFSSFLAEVQQEGVLLSLVVGTTHQLVDIQFEQEIDGTFSTISSKEPALSLHYRYLDESPKQGNNLYRARLLFSNGSELVSEPQSVYYLDKTFSVVFPNPLRMGQQLKVFSKQYPDSPGLFKLYDQKGRLVFGEKVYTNREYLQLPPLAPGLYFYSLHGWAHGMSGKLIILE